MALPQAQLGQIPMINLGGYIPAPAERLSPYERALAAFLQGAAGTVAGNLVDKVIPNPNEVAAREDRRRQIGLTEQQIANQKEAELRAHEARIAAMRQQGSQFDRTFSRDVDRDLFDRSLRERGYGLEERRTNAGIRQTDAGLNIQRGEADSRNALRTVQGTGIATGARLNAAQAEELERRNEAVRQAAEKQQVIDQSLKEPVKPEPGWAEQVGNWLTKSIPARTAATLAFPQSTVAPQLVELADYLSPGVSERFDEFVGKNIGPASRVMYNNMPVTQLGRVAGDALSGVEPQHVADSMTWASPVFGVPATEWLKKQYLQTAQ